MANRDPRNLQTDDETWQEEQIRRAREDAAGRQAGQRRDADEPQREGDVLGISDAPVDVGEPHPIPGGGRRPSGIEVGKRATGIGDVPQSDGASGVDMGGGGEGTGVKDSTRRRANRNLEK